MNELISTLIGLNAMHDTHIISEDDYVSNLGQLCGEYGTEVVAETMLRLGLA